LTSEAQAKSHWRHFDPGCAEVNVFNTQSGHSYLADSNKIFCGAK